MSTKPDSPFDATPNSSDARPPGVDDLFQANKAANQRSATGQFRNPAEGMPTIPGYKPSGRVGPLGAPLLLVALLVLPVVASTLYEKLFHFGGMLIFSTLALGILTGFAFVPAVQFGKVRSPAIAAVIGALIGLATFGGVMVQEAMSYRPAYVQDDTDYLVKAKGLQPAQAKALVEAHYTPLTMTKTYWEDSATAGMLIKSSRRMTTSQLTGNMFWAVKVMEFFLITLAVIGFGVFQAKRPYSEEFDRWYKAKQIGTVPPEYFADFMRAIEARDWLQVHQVLTRPCENQFATARVTATYVPEKPGGQLHVTAKANKNKDLLPVLEFEMSNEEMKQVWPEFPAPVSA